MAARINPPVQIGQYRDHTSQFIEIRQRAAREHQVSDSEDVRWVSTPSTPCQPLQWMIPNYRMLGLIQWPWFLLRATLQKHHSLYLLNGKNPFNTDSHQDSNAPTHIYTCTQHTRTHNAHVLQDTSFRGRPV